MPVEPEEGSAEWLAREARRAALRRGAQAESAVARELELLGWTVLERNWRGGRGEIDLVARFDGEVRPGGDGLQPGCAGAVRFVEVKARELHDGSGAEAVTGDKQRKLISAAETWLLERGDPPEVCFAVAVVTMRDDGRWSIEWIDDAFDG